MSKLDLDAIKKRVAAATPGPWEAYLDPEVERYDPTVCANGHVVCRLNDETDWEDVQFIAHARDDIPALCDEVERLTHELTNERDEAMALLRRLVYATASRNVGSFSEFERTLSEARAAVDAEKAGGT